MIVPGQQPLHVYLLASLMVLAMAVAGAAGLGLCAGVAWRVAVWVATPG